MIGSPASRGAIASMGWRASLATAPAVSTVSAAIATSVTIAGAPQRRIGTVDRTILYRFNMPRCGCNALPAHVDHVADPDLRIVNRRHNSMPRIRFRGGMPAQYIRFCFCAPALREILLTRAAGNIRCHG